MAVRGFLRDGCDGEDATLVRMLRCQLRQLFPCAHCARCWQQFVAIVHYGHCSFVADEEDSSTVTYR